MSRVIYIEFVIRTFFELYLKLSAIQVNCTLLLRLNCGVSMFTYKTHNLIQIFIVIS